jgi:hypothetical protein
MPRRRREDGRFISNLEADRLDGIETSLPDSDENIETASERGDEDMTSELPLVANSQRLRMA